TWLLTEKMPAGEEEKAPEEKPSPQKPESINRKPNDSRDKRPGEQLANRNAKKAAPEGALADPAVYQDPARLQPLLADQAYLAKELEALETEWLERQAELEAAG